MCLILTCSLVAQLTFSQLGFVYETVCVSVCVCLPPAPSVSVSAAGCVSLAAPARHHGIQEGTAVRRKWDQRAGCYGLPVTTYKNNSSSSSKCVLVR